MKKKYYYAFSYATILFLTTTIDISIIGTVVQCSICCWLPGVWWGGGSMRAAAAALLLEAVHQQPATITSISRLLANRGYWPSRGEERRRGHSTGPGSINNCFTTPQQPQSYNIRQFQHLNISTSPRGLNPKHCYNLQLRKEYFCSLLYSICLTISFNGIYTISI